MSAGSQTCKLLGFRSGDFSEMLELTADLGTVNSLKLKVARSPSGEDEVVSTFVSQVKIQG